MSELETQFPFTPIDQRLFEARTVFITGVVNSEMAHKVNRELLALEKADPKKPILMWINSPGGEVDSGFSIYDTIQFISPTVVTLVAGMAASMGSVIALAADKENRLAFSHAHILIHQPLIGGVIQGPASDIEIHARRIIETKKKIYQLYAKRTGTDIKVFEEMMERDRSLTVEEALDLGLISKEIKKRDELEKYLK